jgi:hypothetical protein
MNLSHCVTCQHPLTPSQITNGTRRCKACRKAHPGRAFWWHDHDPHQYNHWMNRQPADVVERVAVVDSWWMSKPQAGFTAEAETRSLRMSSHYKQRSVERMV